ncbi:MAG: caspase family protein, partial [Bradyrhizobium sp.]|uniref:caspase family protein n=1 Tax=Bradyrhizobium sp. TaxID=376 RepID=UPI003C7413A7
MRSAFLFLFGVLLLLSTDPALAEKRVALVVGISKYQQAPRLTNPARDADAVAALLKQAGFDVVNNQRDLGIVDLRRVIREFSETSRDADISVVYYAGHGIEVDGTNYLVPADAKLASDFD